MTNQIVLFRIKENFSQKIKSCPYLHQKDVAIDFKGAWISPERSYYLFVSFHNVRWHILKGRREKTIAH